LFSLPDRPSDNETSTLTTPTPFGATESGAGWRGRRDDRRDAT
jgi:hypothetical protein